MKEMLKEILDRVRRLETMTCRHVSGKPDQKTKLKVETWATPDGLEVDVNSMDVSLHDVVAAARLAGCGADEFIVCDNGKPRLSVREMTYDNP